VKLDRLFLATTNRGKVRDFGRLFEPEGIEVVSALDVGLNLDVEETGDTFAQNAGIKAAAYAQELARVGRGGALRDIPVLADDSGIEVHALGGAPGVFSARYAGDAQDAHANNLKLIDNMRGVADRRAAFVVALVLTFGDGTTIEAEGRCEGEIADAEAGSNGFGYDSVFWRSDLGCTFAQASPEQKNARSHRAAAVARLIELLRAENRL